jgi:hypothetical protein
MSAFIFRERQEWVESRWILSTNGHEPSLRISPECETQLLHAGSHQIVRSGVAEKGVRQQYLFGARVRAEIADQRIPIAKAYDFSNETVGRRDTLANLPSCGRIPLPHAGEDATAATVLLLRADGRGGHGA